MSSSGWSLLPGLMGVEGFVRSQMNISDSLAPEARRLGWKGFTSRVRTAPVCWEVWATRASGLELEGVCVDVWEEDTERKEREELSEQVLVKSNTVPFHTFSCKINLHTTIKSITLAATYSTHINSHLFHIREFVAKKWTCTTQRLFSTLLYVAGTEGSV